MAIAILVIAFAHPPTPSVPARTPASPTSTTFHEVDIIVVNQYYHDSISDDGTRQSSVVFYISFWSVHQLRPWSSCQIPMWEYRGWCRDQPLLPCDGGWSCQVNGNTIVAPRVLFIASNYDFEYRNRRFGFGRLVTNR